MKHPEPRWLVQWRLEHERIPRCCHTCEAYDEHGQCHQFNLQPPEDFAGTRDNGCDQWLFEIPF